MREDLLELLTAEIESNVKRVAELFEQEKKLALLDKFQLGHAPIIGFSFHARENERQHIEHLQHLACRALGAQTWFERTASLWAQPLPVSCDELKIMLGSYVPARMQLRREFALSLKHHDWDFWRHPEWRPYACTVMGHEETSDVIKRDRELCEEFPPQQLVELRGGCGSANLCWLSPEMKARDEAFWKFRRLRDEGVPVDEARKRSGFYPR
jgi:hypothetical protein